MDTLRHIVGINFGLMGAMARVEYLITPDKMADRITATALIDVPIADPIDEPLLPDG